MVRGGLLLVFLGACAVSGDPVPSAGDAGPRADGQVIGRDGQTPVTEPATRCSASVPCVAGMFCSAAETCVPSGLCGSDVDCARMPGFACDMTTRTCKPGSACGAEEYASNRVVPNLLVVLDRSCSMNGRDDWDGDESKWQTALTALSNLSSAHDGDVRWGLITFPDPGGDRCSQEEVAVPLGDNQGAALRTLLGAATSFDHPQFPNGPCVTNIDAALMQAAAYPGLVDPAHPPYVLFVSDGAQQFCGNLFGADERSLATIQSMSTQGVATFVVGFGRGVDGATLRGFAQAGGRAPANAEGYYQANNPASLQAALDTIVQGVVSCDYAIDRAPADLARTFVFFDDARRVERDPAHQNGWDYDSNGQRVTLYGAACDELKRGAVHDVDIVFGCPEPVLE